MVAVLPAENSARSLEIAQEADEFSRAHYDGFSWSDVYVIPTEEYRLADRRITLVELAELLGGRLPAASRVESGYSIHVEDLPSTFAFGEAYSGSGAFYGDAKGGMITTLYVIPPDRDDRARVAFFSQVLTVLGNKYNLILADCWHHHVLDLR